jgi:sugar O-acyltransferase (sialic acid O-acetyltransferase NeuD family)
MSDLPVQPILILGTHLLALELADLISEIPAWRVAGFVENLDPQRCREPLLDLPVHWIDEVGPLARDHYAVCGISTTRRVQFIEQAAALGMPFATIVHPSARVSSKSTLGPGTILSSGVQVASYTTVGRHVFVNRGAMIGHHTTIGDYVTIQPGANVAGVCDVGQCAWISMSAIVLERMKIGAHAVVAAGAVVTKDVPDHVQVVGVPARIVKEIAAGK